MAVVFFFVLGGFCMTLGYKEKVVSSTFDYNQYLTRRCIKFYPLHWFCLLMAIPLSLFFAFSWYKLPVLILNASLIHSWIPIKEVCVSYNYVSWYLADTLFFSMVFPPLLKCFLKSNAIRKVWIALLIILFYAVIALLIPKDYYQTVIYISPYMRLTDFVFGIYLALLYLKIKDNPQKWWNGKIVGQILVLSLIVLLVVESCVLPETATWFAPVYWVLIGALIITVPLVSRVGGGLLLENKYLLRLGELSFIIFMVHQLVLNYITIVFAKLQIDNLIIYLSFTLVLTILLSIVIERFILKPITQWLTSRNQPSMTVRS